jgi:tetratricopeptide (TPR) repeat protein
MVVTATRSRECRVYATTSSEVTTERVKLCPLRTESSSMIRFIGLMIAVFVLIMPTVLADEGHHHDEVIQQQLGTVHFPTSCAPGVQKTFDRGVALLHSFAFDTAEATFRQVLKSDPHCAMAHWGIAKSMWRWGRPEAPRREQGLAEIKAGKSLHPGTLRESDYLSALGKLYAHPKRNNYKREAAFTRDMERLHRRYPGDFEASAFYACALIASDDDAHANRKKASVILEALFKLEPNHPGVAHYLIHSYDVPGMAELGLPAARRYAKIAPAAPHALHMPSHIFARLGLWQEDIDSNLASVAASRNAAVTHMGDEGHQYHAMEFLMYAYLQSGREVEAQKLIEEVKSLPKMKSMYAIDADPQVYALLSFSAGYLLELHHWRDAAVLSLTPGTEFGDDSITYLARAIGAARSGDAVLARRNEAEIESIYKKTVAKKLPFVDWEDQERKEAEAWADHAEGDNEPAIALLRAIADKQKEGVFGVTGDLPAREMLADMLLEMNRPGEALAEYETQLKINPNRFNSLYGAGRAAEMDKQSGKASAYYQQLLKVCSGGNSGRPELAYAHRLLATKATKN